MAIHVMLDLETLGTSAEAVPLSIGAVKFDTDSLTIVDRFHVGIDPVSAQAHGLKIDASTVMWWLDPDRYNARVALAGHERLDLGTALEGFQSWFGNVSLPTWGNGAAFDNVILRSAYVAAGLSTPWEFWDDRCYRTLKGLLPSVKSVRQGTHHDALDDATYQTEHLFLLVQTLGVRL